MTRLLGTACVLALIAGASLGIADRAGSKPTALQVSATGAPQRVHGSDGREHIEYDLVITNSSPAEVTLTSLVVRGGGRPLLDLRGDPLTAATIRLGGSPAATGISPSSTVAVLVDVVMPRSAGRSVPKRLRNRITYAFSPGEPAPPIIGSYVVRAPVLSVDRRAPIKIAPPLRGDGWLSANACCDPGLEHRSFIFPANGTYVTAEMFAVDYIRLADRRFYEGGGTENASWVGYGAPVRAAAAGKVVSAVDDLPDVPPFIEPNPTVTKPSQFAGNNVVVKIRPGVFAHYDHLQPGSEVVDVGERVRAGQKLGLLGNSGNTAGPHLHFGITDGRHPLTSDSLPFEIDRFGFEGTASPGPAPGELVVTGRPHGVRRAHPLATSLSDYSR